MQHLIKQHQEKLLQLITQYPEVFTNKPGRADVPPISIKTTSETPITQSPYGIPPHKRDAVQREIDALLKEGIIRKSVSPWASPVVLVTKSDGSIRICINYKKLNAKTVEDNYPLPNIDLVIQAAASSPYISTLDMAKGFHQIKVEPESIPKTAFILPEGKYEYVRMPFGLRNAPAHFQWTINDLLSHLSFSKVYIDDIIIYSDTFEEHIDHLKQVLDILKQHGLTVKVKKCKLVKDSLDFLGHKIGKGFIQPQDAKIKAMKDYKLPQTKKSLRSFLGSINYYRKFIPNFALLASPLYSLTRKSEPHKLSWTEEQLIAFQTLKEALTNDSILIAPDYSKPFLLATDGSYAGIGAVLSQIDDNNDERRVAYYSRRLSAAERNYAVTEVELLAVVEAVKHFQIYLLGKTFNLITDHKALVYLDHFKNYNKRLVR